MWKRCENCQVRTKTVDHKLRETPKKLASCDDLAKDSAAAEIWGNGPLIRRINEKVTLNDPASTEDALLTLPRSLTVAYLLVRARLVQEPSIMSDPKPSTSAPDLDILGDQVTIHPAGYAQPPALGREGEEQNLVEHMARFRDSPFDFLREVSLHVSGAGWRAYDDVIGQPIYYSGFTENTKAKVMKVPLLKTKIQQLSSNRVEVEDKQGLFGDDDGRLRRRSERRKEIENSLREVAAKMTDDMICKMESKRFIRGAYYLATQLLTRAYHQGGHLSDDDSKSPTKQRFGRHTRLKRRGPSATFSRRRSSLEKAVYHFLAVSPLACRLCLSSDYMLSFGNCSTYSGLWR